MSDRPAPEMVRHVQAVWPESELPELLDSAGAVELMLQSAGWKAMQRVLEREVATIDRKLDNGLGLEAVDYAKSHGRRGALRSADEAARAIIAQAARRRQEAEEAQTSEAGESASEGTGD